MLRRVCQCQHLIQWINLFLACLVSDNPVINTNRASNLLITAGVVCPRNEIYVNSVAKVWCKPQSCSDLGSIGCVGIKNRATWRPGCMCQDGFLRDESGSCVPVEQCNNHNGVKPASICKNRNEEYLTCGSACERRCRNYLNPIICPTGCTSGCFCKEGYVRFNRECIMPKDCPVRALVPTRPICPYDEVFHICVSACPATCSNPDSSYEDCTLPCKPGCQCKGGLVRDITGKCIPRSHCPVPCPDDEIYHSCGTACPETCSNRGKPVRCTKQCSPGCFCPKGLVRDENGKCVDTDSCPTTKPIQCNGDTNAEYVGCKRSCVANCNNLWRIGPCKKGKECNGASCECVAGCQCKIGFVKGPDGNCIRPGDCPHFQCQAGEEFDSCGSACTATCENPEPECDNQECVAGCVCAEGMVRDMYGTCVLIEDCYKTFSPFYGTRTTEGSTESLESGGTTTTEESTESLESGGNTTSEESTESLESGGTRSTEESTESLESGATTTDSEEETSESEEESTCENPNEEYSPCGTACPKTCENYDQDIPCTFNCVAGCFCRSGFVRSENGTCINEQYCPALTSQENDEDFVLKAIADIPDDNNEGPEETLRRGFICGKNEVFSECIVKCPPKTCEALNKMYKCLAEECTPGCTCKTSYLRDENGICIPSNQCPQRNQTQEDIKLMIKDNIRRTGTELYRVNDIIPPPDTP